ncbi:coiled-coil domain-containing protein 148-like isoform X2 [Ornithodoros turicata]|uniref:coiled-coil domain-containing protein 148-like isoform X2 n=1 Tax=Ornithodoros turicata TaxID=34597 RepID=UPI003138C3FD
MKLEASIMAKKKKRRRENNEPANEEEEGGGGKGKGSFMKQHKKTWQNEFKKLKDQEEKLKNDIVDKLRYISSTGLSNTDAAGQCLEDWIDFELDRTKFTESATSRISWFKRILQRRLGGGSDDEEEDDQEELQKDFLDAAKEYREVTAKLEEAQKEAEAELQKAFDIPVLTKAKFAFARDVEEDFLSKFHASEKTKRQLLSELKQTDHKFQGKIKDIDKAHKLEEEPVGWNPEEEAVVQHVLDQYPSQLGNRRALIMDWLKRRFPEKSILDISTYMTWCQNQKFHKEKINSCIQDWESARGQWLNRALAVASKEVLPEPKITQKKVRTRRGISLPPPIINKSTTNNTLRNYVKVPEPKKRIVLPRIGRSPQKEVEMSRGAVNEQEWRSLSTVRELEALKQKAREGDGDKEEVVRLQRRLSMERVKFRQEMAMKKQWDRMKAEEKRQDELGRRKLKQQMKYRDERSQILQEANWQKRRPSLVTRGCSVIRPSNSVSLLPAQQ